jgi:hypothetical protein
MMYTASRKVWETIADHVRANRLGMNQRPTLAGSIGPANARRILDRWQ